MLIYIKIIQTTKIVTTLFDTEILFMILVFIFERLWTIPLFPYFRYTFFFSKHYTNTPTLHSKWTEDHGYNFYSHDNIQLDEIPARTSGISYYHRLVLRLHSFSDFLGCPDHNYMEGFYIVSLGFLIFICYFKFMN